MFRPGVVSKPIVGVKVEAAAVGVGVESVGVNVAVIVAVELGVDFAVGENSLVHVFVAVLVSVIVAGAMNVDSNGVGVALGGIGAYAG